MRVFVIAVALSATLAAGPAFAQAAAPQTQKPAAPAAQAPAQPAAPAPRFQEGLKYAYVQIQAVAAQSNQGKAFNAKVQALQDQKVKELQDKNKQLQATQDKLDKGASVLNDSTRAQLQADIEKQQRDMQRAQEDAQQEIQGLTQQLQGEFYRMVMPVVEKVSKEKQVHFVFDAQQSGLVWADPSMNLTADVIRAMDGSTAKPTAPAAAAPAKP